MPFNGYYLYHFFILLGTKIEMCQFLFLLIVSVKTTIANLSLKTSAYDIYFDALCFKLSKNQAEFKGLWLYLQLISLSNNVKRKKGKPDWCISRPTAVE